MTEHVQVGGLQVAKVLFDFVNNEGDLEHLLNVVQRMRKGTQHYIPLSSRRG